MPNTPIKFCLTNLPAAAIALIVLLPAAVCAQNVAANPSAEKVAADGTPLGWGMYVGAGRMKLTAAADEKHSGQRSACLELTDWYTPPGAANVPAQRSISGAIVLAHQRRLRGRGRNPLPAGPVLRLLILVQRHGPFGSRERDRLAVGQGRRQRADRDSRP